MPGFDTLTVDVAVIIRGDAMSRLGGDVVQAQAITDFLRKIGLTVQLMAVAEPCDVRARLAILFNLTTPYETWLQARALRHQGVPYLLFPVYWNLSAAIPLALQRYGQQQARWPHHLRSLKQLLGFILAQRSPWRFLCDTPTLLQGGREVMRMIVKHSVAVLPNSQAETEHLAGVLNVMPDERWRVIRNGVTTSMLPSLTTAVQDQVICIGNIGPRKNQLVLAHAAHQISVPVLIVGSVAPGHDDYMHAVRAAAPPNVQFLGELGWSEAMELLGRSVCHCQPSFIETPGLATLEAAAMGCAVVVSDRPSVREYVEGIAEFCEPEDPASVVAAIEAARHRRMDRNAAAAAARTRFDWMQALSPLESLPAVQALLADRQPGGP